MADSRSFPVNRLLAYIAKNELYEAEEMVKKEPELLFERGTTHHYKIVNTETTTQERLLELSYFTNYGTLTEKGQQIMEEVKTKLEEEIQKHFGGTPTALTNFLLDFFKLHGLSGRPSVQSEFRIALYTLLSKYPNGHPNLSEVIDKIKSILSDYVTRYETRTHLKHEAVPDRVEFSNINPMQYALTKLGKNANRLLKYLNKNGDEVVDAIRSDLPTNFTISTITNTSTLKELFVGLTTTQARDVFSAILILSPTIVDGIDKTTSLLKGVALLERQALYQVIEPQIPGWVTTMAHCYAILETLPTTAEQTKFIRSLTNLINLVENAKDICFAITFFNPEERVKSYTKLTTIDDFVMLLTHRNVVENNLRTTVYTENKRKIFQLITLDGLNKILPLLTNEEMLEMIEQPHIGQIVIQNLQVLKNSIDNQKFEMIRKSLPPSLLTSITSPGSLTQLLQVTDNNEEMLRIIEHPHIKPIVIQNLRSLKNNIDSHKFEIILKSLQPTLLTSITNAISMVQVLQITPNHEHSTLINSFQNWDGILTTTEAAISVFNALQTPEKNSLFLRVKGKLVELCARESGTAPLQLLATFRGNASVDDYRDLYSVIRPNIQVNSNTLKSILTYLTPDELVTFKTTIANFFTNFEQTSSEFSKLGKVYCDLLYTLIKDKLATLPCRSQSGNSELDFLSPTQKQEIVALRQSKNVLPTLNARPDMNRLLWSHNTYTPTLFRSNNYTDFSKNWSDMELEARTNLKSRAALTIDIMRDMEGFQMASDFVKANEFRRIYAILQTNFPTPIARIAWSEADREKLNLTILNDSYLNTTPGRRPYM